MSYQSRYRVLETASVRDNPAKMVPFLRNSLVAFEKSERLVIFLGERHGDANDVAVTQAILREPPVTRPGHNLVIFERGLAAQYLPFTVEDHEEADANVPRGKRSEQLALMVHEGFERDKSVIYLPCGDEHAQEVYDALLLPRITGSHAEGQFDFIVKMSMADAA